MNAKRMEQSKRIVAMGPTRYIVLYGVILWGGLTGTLTTLILHFFLDKPFVSTLAINMIAFPIGGIFWGMIMYAGTKRFVEKHEAGS